MRRFLEKHWAHIILSALVIVYSFTFSVFSLLRYNSFWSGLDLGNMDQTVWNTLHGNFFTLTNNGANMTRFAVHADFLLVVLAPLYALWSSPKLLLILQSLYLGLGAVPAYLIAKKILKKDILALGIAVLYLVNPLIQWVNIFDFHMVSLAVPLFLLIFYFFHERRWKLYWLSIVVLLLCKEEIGLLLFMFGFFQFTFMKARKVGLLTAGVGLSYSLLMVFTVIPSVSVQRSHWFWSWYSTQQLLTNPKITEYLLLLAKSFGFLPIIGLPWLFLGAPELLINLVSTHTEMQSIHYHYTSVLIPVAIIASIYGLLYVQKLLKKYSSVTQYCLLIGALVITLRVNYHYGPLPTTESCWCYPYHVSSVDRAFDQRLRAIPTSASVTSSPELHAHLTQRRFAYVLPYATQSADFIVLIDQVRSVDTIGPKPEELALIQKLNKEKKYHLIWHKGHYFLYQRQPNTK